MAAAEMLGWPGTIEGFSTVEYRMKLMLMLPLLLYG
jgi:hypothetical protein